jgi:DNA-binding response OmpR family regulator
VLSTLRTQPNLQVIGEASDGPEGVQKARELQPDLIVLDIGLPTLNGIEVARRIRNCAPQSKILFASENRSLDIAKEALRTGARGYVVKSDAARELLPAVDTVLQGKQFVSGGLCLNVSVETLDTGASESHSISTHQLATSTPHLVRDHGHVVQFYTDDANLLDNLCPLFSDALSAGESVVAIITRSHRQDLLERLIAHGIDVGQATKEARLVVFDAVEVLNGLMEAGELNRERFLLQLGYIIRATEAAVVEKTSLVVFGEMVTVLWEQKKYDAAIRLEQLWNELAQIHSFYLCCGYPASAFREDSKGELYAAICAEHTDVVSTV